MGINLNFKENSVSWGDYQANMKDDDVTLAEGIANKHKELVDGTLGIWKNFQYDIKLQEEVNHTTADHIWYPKPMRPHFVQR
eukprot:12137758-Ditylum_brightwellii.AAC.1